MPKKQATEIAVVHGETNARTSLISDSFVFTEQERQLAINLRLDINASSESRLNIAVGKTNQALGLVVEAGLLFLSIKAESKHGEFLPMLEGVGVSPRRANECMTFARAAATLPEEQREMLFRLPKMKAMTLASADPEVLEDLLAEDGDLTLLGVRELRQRIRELEADKANLSVDGDTLKAERDSLAKQLKRRSQSEEDSGVPIVVLDIRAEAAALVKKAELALTSIYPLGVELAGLRGHDLAGPWVEPSTRLVLAGLVALQVQLAGLVVSYAESIDADIGAEPPAELAHLQPSEVQTVAKEWAELTALHNHEAALRQHDRDAARPRGKGRPASAPQLKA